MQHDDLVYVGQMVDVAVKIEERALRERHGRDRLQLRAQGRGLGAPARLRS